MDLILYVCYCSIESICLNHPVFLLNKCVFFFPKKTRLYRSCLLIWVGGTRWRSWLRHCATSQKVTGLIPDGIIGIFHRCNPSCRNIALGLTWPLTEMSTRNISLGGKGGQCVWLTTLHHLHVPIVLKSGNLNLLESSGPLQACHGIAVRFY